jgi:hypothetical protein
LSVNADLIARIRKILDRTEEAGCTPEEAENAYAMASGLMAKHNLDMAQVEQAAGLDGEGWADEIVHESGRASSVLDAVSALCARYFFVTAHRRRTFGPDGKWRVVQMFFGSPTNVETARFIFASLVSAIDRLWREEYRRGFSEKRDRSIFGIGVVRGYSAKLEAERASMIREHDRASGRVGTALALQTIKEKTSASFDAANPDCRTIRRRPIYGSPESLEAGEEAGRKLNLSRPLAADGGQRGLPGK